MFSKFSLGAWRTARDSADLGPIIGGKRAPTAPGLPCGVADWFKTIGFIGHQQCAEIAQHWLVDKACAMPGRDAIRQGYAITGADGGAELALRAVDKRMGINRHMADFIRAGRVFGVRVALFKVASTDPHYYERPFNLDGVAPGSYRGIVQIDPTWVTPELDSAALSDPASASFREPLYYVINSKRYHRSHLAVFIPYPVADVLKPSYLWGGASVPQRIAERVYAAERTANEGPLLAMTKRLTVLKVDMAQALSNWPEFLDKMRTWTALRDNHGVKVIDMHEEAVEQHDTALGDLDATTMTQYQLVAAAANVPATKLLGTTPKGFNGTGEYEEAVYREELESIQTNDLTPLLERHHALAMRSEVAPRLGIAPVPTTVTWAPLDSPTAAEWATINKTKAETDVALAGAGAIDGRDIRNRLKADPNSDYANLEEIDDELAITETGAGPDDVGAAGAGGDLGGPEPARPAGD